MIAFQAAVDLGYRYLETDVHASADGVLVCHHDATLERTTDGAGPVSQRHVADLRSLDAGFRFNPMHHFPHRGAGAAIPTLEELATTFPSAVITVDLKQAGIEQLMVDTIARLDVWDRVIVGSFSGRRVKKFRTLTKGRVATSAGPSETARLVLGAKAGRSPKIEADVLQVPERHKGIHVVNQRLVEVAHSQGKQVHVWTIDDPDEMARLFDMGVDGIVTDRPDLLKDVIVNRYGEWKISHG